MSNSVPIKQLMKAYQQAAKIVSIYGETYLPIFERLEKEYNNRIKQADALSRAIELAKNAED